MSMKLVSQTLTGLLHANNKGACDWGWQGQLAYGCQNHIVIVDPNSVQVIQTLDKHKGYVVKVRWARENYHHDLASPYSLRLASADASGRIIVWDVAQASVRAEFSDGSRPIADMEWLSAQDASHDLLAVLHPSNNLIVWNADTGQKLWRKSYNDTLLSFSFDPFDPSKVAFLGQDCILFVDDFSISKTPSSNGRKYYISNPSNQGNKDGNASGNTDKSSDKKPKSTIKRMSNILVGEATKRTAEEETSTNLNDCLQLVFHQACRHHIILVYPREVLVLDLDINQTVGIIPMERTGSPFVQVIPLRMRDVMMCLHENGGITVRVRRRTNQQVPATPSVEQVGTYASQEDAPIYSFLDVSYDLRCQSDPLRVTKHQRVFGMTCSPVSEKQVALVMSDSRVLFWELKTVDYEIDENTNIDLELIDWPEQTLGSLPAQTPLFTPGVMTPAGHFQMDGSGDMNLPLMSNVPYPKSGLGDLIGHCQTFVMDNHNTQNRHGVMLKFVLMGLLSGVAPPPLVIRMCPPLTTKNWNVYQPLLALGTSSGQIQVYNLFGASLSRELSVHSCPVKGIEWVSLHSFLSFAFPNPGTNNLVKNELVLTNIQTGKTTQIRTNRDEESPIEILKVSYLKQYFVIVFKDKPFELWDLRTATLLRQMPKNFPHVTSLEWSPSHNLKSLKKKLTQQQQDQGFAIGISQSTSDLSSSTAQASLDSALRTDTKPLPANISAKEHFVFTDSDGLLYHFLVEGNVIKEGSRIPPDGGMGSITSIAWKGDTMVLGDVDGNLNVWDLKNRVSRAVPSNRGWIKKLKFAPGRNNMKLLVLYNDGADIWDTKEVEAISCVKTPKDIAKVLDADWAASDRPALACADGCVRIMDIKFKSSCSPITDLQLPDPVFCPHLLPPKASLTLKYLLQHQPWSDTYKLELTENEQNADICRNVNQQLELLDNDMKAYLPKCHFGTAQRCLLTASLFGDESEVSFWTIALHYLRAEKAEPLSKTIPRSSSQGGTGDLFVPSTPAKESFDLLNLEEENANGASKKTQFAFLKDRPLETCFDILCDSQTFQKYQLDRVSLHDSKRATYEHTRKCAENLMMLGQTDRAVQLLLETDAENDNYYIDSLRACLVASIRSSGASQSTIKLVATNLIANGKLSEGVQLLCLIDKGLDACRYLQTYGAWYQAAWLAKATLNYAECSEVLRRWVEHLSSPQVNQKSKAILVLLSLGQFVRVIEMLYNMRHFDRAALFVEACQEFALLDTASETAALVEAVFLEYARLLLTLGNRKAAEYYMKQAGEKGSQLAKEIENFP